MSFARRFFWKSPVASVSPPRHNDLARYLACSSLFGSSRSRRLVPPLSQRYTSEACNQRRRPDPPRWGKKRRRRRTRPRPSQRRTATAATASFAPCARLPSPSRMSVSTRKSSRWSRKVRRAKSRLAFQHAFARRDDHAHECCALLIPHETNESLVSPSTHRARSPARFEPTASKHKQVKRGVKEVVKALRKDTKGCVPGSSTPRGFPRNRAPRRPDRRPAVARFLRHERVPRSVRFFFADLPFPLTFAAFASSRATSHRSM